MRLDNTLDIHAHTGPLRADAVVCVDPTERACLPDGQGWLSVGVHPWNAERADAETWARMERWLDDPRVVAVGEVGLDRLRGPAMDVQERVFMRQVDMAAQRGLPVVVHCVRAVDVLLRLRRATKRAGQWVVHGFRGKAATARQLLDAGIDISFGERHDAEAFAAVPPERRYRETDR